MTLILEIAAAIILAVLVLANLEYALIGAAILLGGAVVLVLVLLAVEFPADAVIIIAGIAAVALLGWLYARAESKDEATRLEAEAPSETEPQSYTPPDPEPDWVRAARGQHR